MTSPAGVNYVRHDGEHQSDACGKYIVLDARGHFCLHAFTAYYQSSDYVIQVLLPVHFDRSVIERQPSFQRSVVLRPFKSQDFMTGVPGLPGVDIPNEVTAACAGVKLCFMQVTIYRAREQVVTKMVSEILTVPGISRVLYDLTAKPPATTEWE